MSKTTECVIGALDRLCVERERLLKVIQAAQDEIQRLELEYKRNKQSCLSTH
jgi:hypothetical protein